MFSGLSSEIIVWIVIAAISAAVAIIWGLYRLYSFVRHGRQANITPALTTENNMESNMTIPSEITIINTNGKESVEKSLRSNDASRQSNITSKQQSDNMRPSMTLKHLFKRKRYIEHQGNLGEKSNDRILHEVASNKSLNSSKSSIGQRMKSNLSRKSSGFELTIPVKSVEPVKKGQKGVNFLDLLDKLNEVIDDDQEQSERRERERKKRKYDERHMRDTIDTTSSAGIEANPSDETASQTFIGKEPDSRPDPGELQLGLIKALDFDTSANE